MRQVKLPADVLSSISPGQSETQVVDDTGAVKGYLISPEYRSLVYSWVNTLFDDDDELRLARSEVGGLTTAEAVARLKDIAAAHEGGA